jgi:hypothetical protein
VIKINHDLLELARPPVKDRKTGVKQKNREADRFALRPYNVHPHCLLQAEVCLIFEDLSIPWERKIYWPISLQAKPLTS